MLTGQRGGQSGGTVSAQCRACSSKDTVWDELMAQLPVCRVGGVWLPAGLAPSLTSWPRLWLSWCQDGLSEPLHVQHGSSSGKKDDHDLQGEACLL